MAAAATPVPAGSGVDAIRLSEIRHEIQRTRSELQVALDAGNAARKIAEEHTREAAEAQAEAARASAEARAEAREVAETNRRLREALPEEIQAERDLEQETLERLRAAAAAELKEVLLEEKDAWREAAEERAWADAEHRIAVAARSEVASLSLQEKEDSDELRDAQSRLAEVEMDLHLAEKAAARVEATMQAEEQVVLGAIGVGNIEEAAEFARRAWRDQQLVTRLEQEMEEQRRLQHGELQQKLESAKLVARDEVNAELVERRRKQTEETVALDHELSVLKLQAVRELKEEQRECRRRLKTAVESASEKWEAEVQERSTRLKEAEEVTAELDRRLRSLGAQLASVHGQWASDIEKLHARYNSEAAAARAAAERRDAPRRAEAAALGRENVRLEEELARLQDELGGGPALPLPS
eukprot:TRINITY_DN22591_c1_g1_i1.p1 TRINITY_DN22591_c1_g1~~TRINITY_DN22591_c1_g1_i1.p1  ORF type:complete len:414 (+),score=151.88 TRINITY_DN22591_c1_g1_i1:282-1523(+)